MVARQVFERTAVSRSRGHSLGTVRVEAGSIAEHRAGDVEQAVGYRTQGTGVSVAAGTQSAVLAVAHRITLGSNPSPVAGSLTQPVMGSETARHDHAPAGPAGDRRHAAEAAQRGVVSSLQHVIRLGEQRGENARADARQRQQDGRVRPALRPPSLRLLGRGLRQPAHQAVELATRVQFLLVDQNEAFDDELHMGNCGLGGTRRYLDGLRSQLPAQRGSIDSANAVLFQQAGQRCLANPLRGVGRHCHRSSAQGTAMSSPTAARNCG